MTDHQADQACPCGSGKTLAECCAPYIQGDAVPPTAETLMRSRYTAFCLCDADYLTNTLCEAQRDGDEPTAEDLAKANWVKLDIRATENGGPDDDTGMVEFVARYTADGETYVHHERSTFIREGGRWVYEDGDINPKAQPVRVEKVGRNDPCPCGSGKKYKKCCGK